MQKGEGVQGISGAERSRARLCTSGAVGALQHREWQDQGGGQMSRRSRCSWCVWEGGVQSEVGLNVLRDLFQRN